MSNKELAQHILDALGGAQNIASNTACMTRLRVSVKEMDKVNMDELKSIDGVLGVVEAETIQVVLGPGKVNKVLDEFVVLSGVEKGEFVDAVEDVDLLAKENKASQKAQYAEKPVQKFLRRIANIFIPLLPGIIAAGLINGIMNVVGVSTQQAYAGEWWFAGLKSIGWVMFGYLPILVGYNSAKEFGGSGVLGAIAGALCIANPVLPLLAKDPEGAPKIILPLINAAYNPAAGGMIAALIAGAVFALLEKNFRKRMPNALDTFLSPLLTVIVGGLFMLFIIQPFGDFVTKGIFAGLNFIFEQLGIVGAYLLSAGFLPLVSVGLHQALTPIHVMLNDPNGPTQGVNYLLPILMMAGGGQVGAGLAIYFKTKNAKLKKYVAESVPVGILGIGEPLMYAVTLPLGKPFITACIGSGFGGMVAFLFHLGVVSQGVSGLFGLLIVVPGTWVYYVIAMVTAYIAGFLVTWFFGVDEERIDQVYGK